MKYRAEIDGLRTCAVMPVILFHAGFDVFSGGFVGVDVFFVISGYLITTIIMNELDEDRFSILGFYERRARRILPALTVVVLACIPFAWMWLLPGDFRDFAQSIAAVGTFSSNILFWKEADYFAAATELKPLLHTWSLAVEEQFYIFFPLLLMALWSFGRQRVLIVLAVIFIISLGLTEWGIRRDPVSTFYLLHTRAWELLIGSFCAFALRSGPLNISAKIQSIGAVLGLLLICVSIFAFTKSTPFPSVYALLPTLGTACIILFAQPHNATGKLLGAKPMVGIGLISYSAYLWHQPLIAFAKHRSIDELSLVLRLGLIAATLILAYMTWKFIEAPFRRRGGVFKTRRTLLSASVVLLAGFVVLGAVGHIKRGFPDRQSGDQSYAQLEQSLAINRGIGAFCDNLPPTLSPDCISQKGATPEVLLWGDSYAMHLAEALKSSPNAPPFVQYTKTSCRPVFDMSIVRLDIASTWTEDCIDHNNNLIAVLEANPQIHTVILGSIFVFSQYDEIQLGDLRMAYDQKVVMDALNTSILKIQEAGRNVVVISAPPNTGQNLGRCTLKTLMFAKDETASRCHFARDAVSKSTVESFGWLATLPPVPIIYLDSYICPDGQCSTIYDGVMLYRDKGHLSIVGARRLGANIDLMGTALRLMGTE